MLLGSMSDQPSSSYFHQWYQQNGESLNESRRERYANDPEYKERILQQNREARKRRRKEVLAEKKKKRAVQLNRSSQPWKHINIELKDDKGNLVVTKMFTIGAVAKADRKSVV